MKTLELTDLKKALGETIVKAALENNQLSDSGKDEAHIIIVSHANWSRCTQLIFPKEWNDNIEGTEGQDADHELIGSLYLSWFSWMEAQDNQNEHRQWHNDQLCNSQ